MQSDGSRCGRGPVQAQPKKWSTQSWWEENNVKGWKGEGGEKIGPSMECRSTPAPMVRLGWQWVVITFAALTLAAEDDGSGQKEEGGGNQQEQAKASKDPHDLQREREQQKIKKTLVWLERSASVRALTLNLTNYLTRVKLMN